MALQVFFGDDEHTAKDGTYSRILRARKWLYLSAAAATLLALGLYDADAAAAALLVISLPAWLLSQAVAIGLGYLLVQYALLLYQLGVTYDLVMSERLAFRRADELSAAGDRLAKARHESAAADARFHHEATQEMRTLEVGIAAARDMEQREFATLSTPIDPPPGTDITALITDRQRRADIASTLRANAEEKARDLARRLSGEEPVPELVSLKQSVVEAEEALENLRRENPAARFGYSGAERLIDAARVLPPFLVGCTALLALVRAISVAA